MLPIIRRTGNDLDNPLNLMDREFGRMLRHLWSDVDQGDVTGTYPVDIREDGDHVYIDAELPGFKRNEVQVTLENGILSIVAERKATETKGKEHLRERRFTRVARSFTVPGTVDHEKVDAKLEDGVLKLTLHKRPEVKPRQIEVK